jgi:hypothetical protein
LFVATSLLGVVHIALLHGDGEPACDGSEGNSVDVVVPVQERECRSW